MISITLMFVSVNLAAAQFSPGFNIDDLNEDTCAVKHLPNTLIRMT